MSDDLTRMLAEYAVSVGDGLDARVQRELELRILDTFGAALSGLEEPGPRAARAYASAHVRDDGIGVWGTGLRTTAEAAALANGVAIRALDLNDAYLGLENLHPSDQFAALFATAERMSSSGRQLLGAAAVSYEVGIILCDTFNLRDLGWDHLNITAVAACCGVARLRGLDAGQLAHAIALTVVSRASMRQTRHGELSMWKGFAAGDCVRQAVYACDLALAGVEGPVGAFEGGHGFVNRVLNGTIPNPSALDGLRALRAPNRAGDSHVKLRPFAYAGHSAVEAASRLRPRIADFGRIASVSVETFKVALDIMVHAQSWQPDSRETADHSLPYVVTEMLRRGVVEPASFEPERYRDPDTLAFLAERVQVTADDGFTARFPREMPARVTVVMDDGETISEEVDVPPGHARAPLPEDRLREKFHAGADGVLGAGAAGELERMVLELDRVEDVSAVTALLSRDR